MNRSQRSVMRRQMMASTLGRDVPRTDSCGLMQPLTGGLICTVWPKLSLCENP